MAAKTRKQKALSVTGSRVPETRTTKKPQGLAFLALGVLGLGILTGPATATADANIVVGQSVAGVKLGDTATQVRAALRGQSPEHPALFHDELFYNEFLRISFKQGHVDKVLSYSKHQRTTKGITIGSTQAKVRSAYPPAKCVEGKTPSYVYCVVGSRFQGRRSYTGFLSESPTGGAVEIELGFGSVGEALKHP
jgi:hypothetical protein